jgi:hypothetical protein
MCVLLSQLYTFNKTSQLPQRCVISLMLLLRQLLCASCALFLPQENGCWQNLGLMIANKKPKRGTHRTWRAFRILNYSCKMTHGRLNASIPSHTQQLAGGNLLTTSATICKAHANSIRIIRHCGARVTFHSI